MPTLSFVSVLRAWPAPEQARARRKHHAIVSFVILPGCSGSTRRHPVRTGDGVEVRSFHSPNFNGIFLCPGDPAVGLEQLNVKPLRRERQRHQYVDLFRSCRRARRSFRVRRGSARAGKPSPCRDRHRGRCVLSRAQSVSRHGSGRPHQLKHARRQVLEFIIVDSVVPRSGAAASRRRPGRARVPSTARPPGWRETRLPRRRG